jgi:sterol desaturase/sphingolipid hydroxylase (fatty acid hydroxylase superfamily)
MSVSGDSEWVTVFQRFPEGRVPLTRSIGIFVHDWAHPSDGHPRMFDRDALELVTSANPRIVAAVYIGLAALMFGLSIWIGLRAAAIAELALLGAAVWTLTEYVMHRFAFHFVPRSRLGVALAYLSHGVHHAYPRDPDRLVMPLIVSAPIGVALFAVGSLMFGRFAWPFLGGFALGYLSYDLIHYHIHQHDPARGVFKWLRRYHFQHHFAAPDRQFGVSTPMWDYVFRTRR